MGRAREVAAGALLGGSARKVIPTPNVSGPISVEKLSELSELVKVSRLAELAGIPGQTLATKLKRGTPFSVAEARKISQTLREHGLAVT